MTTSTETFTIEQFKNGFGETRFRFVADSVLHPGQPNRSLHCWKTARAAREAAMREFPRRRKITGHAAGATAEGR